MPILDLIEGDDCRVTDVTASIDLARIANVVTVVSADPEVEPPVWATARDNDPTSPLFVQNGHLLTRRIESGIVTSTPQAQTYADNELADSRSLTQVIEVTHRARPDLSIWDNVRVQALDADVSGVYTVRHFTIDLVAGMQTTTLSQPRRLI